MTYRELYLKLLEYAPMEISDRFVNEGAYDNSGMILETKKEIKTAVFCLDLTSASVNYAVSVGADAIVTHHPAIYRPVKNLLADAPLLTAANAGIGVISNHLNLDGAKEGIDFWLAAGLGGKIVAISDDFGNGEGYGRISVTDKTFGEITENYKKEFGTEKVFAYGEKDKPVRKLASFCGAGLGDEEVEAAVAAGADLVVSADIPHHVLLAALEKNKCVLQLTHYSSEAFAFERFVKKLCKNLKIKTRFYFDERFL